MEIPTSRLHKESQQKSRSIPCRPPRQLSTHNLSFIQTLNATVVVWLQSLVRDTNAAYAKTSTTARPAKSESPILIHSSRSTNQDRHLPQSSPQLMRTLQVRPTLNVMSERIQPSSETEAHSVWDLKLLLELVMDLDLNSSRI